MQIVTEGKMPEIPEQLETEKSPADIGIAVDIGTTTVAVSVWSLLHRKHLISSKYFQCIFGNLFLYID